jgi:2-octaprenyl-3-methyl-6-methoxy-1,4-benzoquinol hydroxylase/2-octaprenylphenol hydroxylase
MVLLEQLGAWPGDASRIRQYQDMYIWTDGSFDSVQFSATELAKPTLGAIAENDLLQYSLQQRAQSLGVSTLWRSEYQEIFQTEDLVSLTLTSGERLQAEWLVVAEGAQSGLRQALGIRSQGWSYQQNAIVCSVSWGGVTANRSGAESAASKALAVDRTAWQRFLPSGPLALLPLASGDSSVVWSLEQQEYERLSNLNDADFLAAFNAAVGEAVGDSAVAVGKRFGFPLRLAQAEKYLAGRCFLVGDSAHSIHPLAGQGLNLGLMDVKGLITAFEKGAEAAHLQAWQRKRRAKTAEMMMLTDGLYRLYRLYGEHGSSKAEVSGFVGFAKGRGLRALVSAGMAAVGAVPLLRQELARLAISAD